ncbi:DinB family protein [Kordia sp. YSTF-M3]|uniref:DinB family protein n=1 Tax=Kordia aestuariivivens TaxID=2759037 RepID=A0ABR7QDQ8_9FLAO|nr:DinB family protein [Kordia aestuariivivens]MBC8756682.1 DinB family protein [Kordia aestuariivivens]
MNFNLQKSIEILERTPEIYYALFNNSMHDWDTINEGENTWSGYNIIGHLIHGEKTDWIPRAEIILGDAKNKTFEPYDRFAQEKLYSSQTTDELLNEFKTLRAENIKKLKSWNLTEVDLNKEGIHPDLKTVTLKELISTWSIHDMIHLNQISRVFVKHYAEDIGPWKNYVRLLNE